MDLVRLWHMCRGEMGYTAWPDPGGVNDQAAWTLDAFAILTDADAKARKEEA